ncbi:OmpA family protein [Salibaculum sp.]|uniref:OmpA family protein n=1 Tax=Salibaculum sp. TaxID=2855480 RepID=UPI002B4869B9|nr:OmpA family protein [Salibaculum sp.]HKL69846.1 OmpA family protein [Salibaculum sp.]
MKRSLILAATALIALSGCDDLTNVFSTREAGSEIDSGYFGNATMNNIQVGTGQANYVINLNQRFSNEVQPTINFAFNSTALDQQARQVLRQQATWINQFPEVRFKVFGHTDLVGSRAYNRQLGLRRAQAAVAYLVSQGVDRGRLEAVVTQGETQPLIVTEGRERRNRRTVTEVTGFVKNHPTVLNGEYAAVIFRDYVSTGVSSSLGGLNPPGLGHSTNLPGGQGGGD